MASLSRSRLDSIDVHFGYPIRQVNQVLENKLLKQENLRKGMAVLGDASNIRGGISSHGNRIDVTKSQQGVPLPIFVPNSMTPDNC